MNGKAASVCTIFFIFISVILSVCGTEIYGDGSWNNVTYDNTSLVQSTQKVELRQLVDDYVSYWRFDEGYGISASDENVTSNNTGLLTTVTLWNTSGKFGSALSFNGSDYVSIVDAPSLDITDAITVEGWMNSFADGWKYKKAIILSHATALANYQIKVQLTTSNFDYSKAKANGEDLRFYQTDGASLDYWIETWNTSGTSTIWVEVATSSTDTIYMYYGNPSVSSASNGIATFEFFDGFLPKTYNYGKIADDGVWYSYYADPDWYGSPSGTFFTSCRPFAKYYNGIYNRTYIVYGGYASPSPWKERITYFNHDNGTVATPVTVADNPGNIDAHANPAIAIDSSGYLYVFYGTNGNYLTKMRKSSNSEDISAWDTEKTIFSARGAYPQPFFIGNILYLFFRYDEGTVPGEFPRAIEYITSNNSGDTWSGRTKIIQQGEDTNPYYVSIKGSDNSIHVAWMWNRHIDFGDNSFWGIYYMYSTDNGSTWKKRDSTAITLPANESTADVVFAKETDELKSVWPLDIQLDNNNNPYIIFISGTRIACNKNYGNFSYKFAKWNGSAWVIYTIATGANHLFDRGALRVIDYNNFKVYLTLGGQSNEDGGEIQEYTSTNGGIDWSKTKDITSDSNNIEHNYPVTVVDGQNDLQIIWSFGDSNPTKVYSWGEEETFTLGEGDIGDVPIGWSETNTIGATFRVISGHKAQYDRISSSGEVLAPAHRKITKIETDNNKCIEFIVKDEALPTQTYQYIRFKETSASSNFGILLVFKNNGNLEYWDGTWHALQTYTQNTEYRIKIYNIDFTNDQFDIDINGVNKGTNLGFAAGQSYFEHIVLDASAPDSYEYMLMDYSFFFTRKYASPEPTAIVGNETVAGISKAGAYGIGTNTTTVSASINNQTISGAISSGWNYITLTYNKDAGSNQMKLYSNGILLAQGTLTDVINTNSNNLTIGDLIAFNGTIDEVRIYNRALSNDEINQTMNNLYYVIGNLTSVVEDATSGYTWKNISFNATIPENTNISIYANTSGDNITFSGWQLVQLNANASREYTIQDVYQKQYGIWRLILQGNVTKTVEIGNVTFYSTEEAVNDTAFIVTLPIGYTYAIFEPMNSTSMNVSANGQTHIQPFYNVSNIGTVNLNIRMKLNESISNVILKANDNNSTLGAVIIDSVLVDVHTGLIPDYSVNIWIWSDFNHTVQQNTNKTLSINVTQSS